MNEFLDALGQALHGVGGSAGVGGIFGTDEERDFAFGGALFEGSVEFGEFTAAKFFVDFGDFAGDTGVAVAENFAGIGDALGDAMRSFIENDRAVFDAQSLESASAFSAAVGKEADEKKFFVGQAAGGERGEKRGRSWNGYNRNVMAQAKRDEAMAWIGNERHAGVADERDLRALFERDEKFGRAGQFVVLVVADERFPNFVVVEQLLCVARVFAGDLVDFFEDSQGAQSDVFEIANRGADKVQAAQRRFAIDAGWPAHAFESSTRCGDNL